MILNGYIAALLYGAACLLLSMIAFKLGVPKTYTRKIVHILVGFEWVILYHTLGVGINFVAVCLIFTVLLVITYKKSLMPMISSDSDNAPGTVYYGISMTAMAIASLFVENFVFAFGIAVFCTSIGDGLAGVIGSSIKSNNPKIYKNKTLFGTLCAFLFSSLSAYVFSFVYGLGLGVPYALLIGAFAAGLELITDFGLDNVTLPLGTATFSYMLLYVPFAENYIAAVVLTPFIIAFALSKKVLTKRGVLAAVVLDIAVSISLGNFGFVMLLSFLLLSTAIDKLKKRKKSKGSEIEKRGEERDFVQVFANGLVPIVFALLYLFSNEFIFVIAYVASLAECFADTVASGVGVFAKSAYDPFRRRKVEIGLSGGMSLLGTLASFVAPVVFLLIARLFGVIDLKWWMILSASAFLGAVFDSFLGSVFQAKYRCSICSSVTEKEEHCDEKTTLISGFNIVTNDLVNLLSVIFTALVSMAIYALI